MRSTSRNARKTGDKKGRRALLFPFPSPEFAGKGMIEYMLVSCPARMGKHHLFAWTKWRRCISPACVPSTLNILYFLHRVASVLGKRATVRYLYCYQLDQRCMETVLCNAASTIYINVRALNFFNRYRITRWVGQWRRWRYFVMEHCSRHLL
jgi:hypothetical protein